MLYCWHASRVSTCLNDTSEHVWSSWILPSLHRFVCPYLSLGPLRHVMIPSLHTLWLDAAPTILHDGLCTAALTAALLPSYCCTAGTWDCLSRIYLEEGIGGFFKGLRSKILQTALNAALMLMLKEQLYSTTKSLLTTKNLKTVAQAVINA